MPGTINFNEAAAKYSDDEAAKYSGPCLLNRDGAPYVTIDQMDKDMVAMLSTMKVSDVSQPVAYTGDQGKKGVRIVFLKSRSEPHRMNLSDDYSKISQAALEEKKALALDKWIKTKMPTYFIMVDTLAKEECPKMQQYASTEVKGF